MAEGNEIERIEGTDRDEVGAPDAMTAPGRRLERGDGLTHDEWDALVRLWAEVARFPLGHAEEAIRYGLVRLSMLLGGSLGAVNLLARAALPADRKLQQAFRGWRPVHVIIMAADGRALDKEFDAFMKPNAYADDPAAQVTVSEPGRRRAYLLSEMIDDESLESSTTKATMELFGSSDRLHAILPLRSTLEAVVFLDRPHGAAPFTARERRVLLEALRGLESAFVALGRSAGYVDCQEPLTPKERLVLNHLLTGRREADIATDLGMGRRSLHQRVVNVYRKFGVSSRPQLMALWLSSSP